MSQMMTEQDLELLAQAHQLLENPGLAAKISNAIGKPVELGLEKLPEGIQEKILGLTHTVLEKGLNIALVTMDTKEAKESSPWTHKLLVATSGGIGGVFGFAALAVELPISTTIMLRSIADIAREEGEDLKQLEARLACLEVFALGGNSTADDGSEVGYYATRMALARTMSEVVEYVVKHGVTEASGPVVVRLIAIIAKRFSIQVTQKAAVQWAPVFGAVTGATINVLFMNHFQDMARGHFCLRKLERKYGKESVQAAYTQLTAR